MMEFEFYCPSCKEEESVLTSIMEVSNNGLFCPKCGLQTTKWQIGNTHPEKK